VTVAAVRPSASGRPVVAVTGAVGKGSIASMLRAVLPAGSVVAELPWPEDPGAGCAALARLSARLRPDVAVMAPWGSGAPANAPALVAALAEGLFLRRGRMVVPADGPFPPPAMNLAALSYGEAPNADIRLLRSAVTDRVAAAEVAIGETRVLVKTGAPGRHFLSDALAVLGVVETIGVDLALAALDIGQWRPAAGHARCETLHLDFPDVAEAQLIDDSASANPASFAAAFEMLAAGRPEQGRPARRGRRVAILGDAPPSREALLAVADVVHCADSALRALWDSLPPSRRGRLAETPEALGRDARRLVGPGDIVLVKGGPASRVSRVVDALRNLGHAGRLTPLEGF